MAMQKGWGDVDKKSSTKASPKTAARKASAPEIAVPSSPPGKRGGTESIEIRPIENGYIIRKSSYGTKKGYESREFYSAKKPDIEV